MAADRIVDVSRSDREPVLLTEYFAVLEDPSLALTLSDVQQPDTASRFAGSQTSTEALSYGFTHSAYWLRLTLRNPSSQPILRMLEISYPMLSHIQFHRTEADGSFRSIVTGVATPFATRPYASRFFVFPLTLPPHTEQAVYLRIESAGSMLIPGRLWEPQAFHAHERSDYTAQAWYFGMAAAMTLFNLLLYIALRDKVYLLYVVFATCTALLVSAVNGFGKEFIWPATTLWSNIAAGCCYAVLCAAMLLFMRRMLNTRQIIPRMDRLIRVLVGMLLLLPIGYFVSAPTFAVISTVILSATGIMILSVGLYCAIFKRQRIAVFFVAAFSMYILGAFMPVLKTIKLLPTGILTTNGLQFGSIMEMLLLAFALAYRFNMIRRQAADDVKEVNAQLELRLKAREADLLASHQQLREVEQRELLNQERQRLTQDMHDGLGSSLICALRDVEHGKLDDTQVAQVLKGCIDDLKLAIDSMEPVEGDLLLLLATFRFRLAPRLEAMGIESRWEIQDVPALNWLNPRCSLHILRILQEAFTNIIKHTDAREIRVATAVENHGVVVTVTDNGQGFDIEQALQSNGKGMSNQTRRARTINCKTDWISSNSGTRFCLWLPLSV